MGGRLQRSPAAARNRSRLFREGKFPSHAWQSDPQSAVKLLASAFKLPQHCRPGSATLLSTAPTHPQVFLGEWHQTAVAVKLLLRGGGQAAAGIGSLGDARQALSLPPQVLQNLDEVRRRLLTSALISCFVASAAGSCRCTGAVVQVLQSLDEVRRWLLTSRSLLAGKLHVAVSLDGLLVGSM